MSASNGDTMISVSVTEFSLSVVICSFDFRQHRTKTALRALYGIALKDIFQ